MTVDSLELLVPRPPTGADAISLAWVHDLYCGETRARRRSRGLPAAKLVLLVGLSHPATGKNK